MCIRDSVLAGLRALAMSRGLFREMLRKLGAVKHINLAEDREFSRLWLENLVLTDQPRSTNSC